MSSEDDPSEGSFGCDEASNKTKRRQRPTHKSSSGDDHSEGSDGGKPTSRRRKLKTVKSTGNLPPRNGGLERSKSTRSVTRRGRLTKGLSLGDELDRMSRHHTMKAAYRVENDDMTMTASMHRGAGRRGDFQSPMSKTSHVGRDDQSLLSRSRHGRGGDDRSITSRSRHSIIQKVDGGPLNMFLNEGNRVARRRITDITLNGDNGSVDPSFMDDCESTQAEDWIQERSSKQDEILSNIRKLKLEKEAEEEERKHQPAVSNVDTGCRICNGEDTSHGKPRPLHRAVKAVTRTVSAVRDPKKAAKNLGNVAKNTVDVVFDPIRAAHLVGDLALGSIDVAADITMTFTKGSLAVTKTVAGGALDATIGVVEGTAAVVDGVAGLIVNRGHEEAGDVRTYNAAELESRRRGMPTLLERVDIDDKTSRSKTKPKSLRPRQDQKSFVVSDVRRPSVRIKNSETWDV